MVNVEETNPIIEIVEEINNINITSESNTINLENTNPIIEVTTEEPFISLVFNQNGRNGNDNLFIQKTQPITELTKYLWIETNEDKTLKTFWVETGGVE